MALACLALVWPAGSTGALGAPTTFADPVGDTSGALDLTEVGVAHTATRGLTFTVSVADGPTLLTGHFLELRLDTDMDVSTGVFGMDRLVHHMWTGQTLLCIPTGVSTFSCAPSPSVSSTYADGLLTVTTTADALGIGGAGFDFSVAGYGGTGVDFAPHFGMWRYLLEMGDVVDPILVVPDAIVVEATSPSGAEVSFAATATDETDPNPTVVCDPPSGSTVPLGTATVTCSATDAAGNSASASFQVSVVDTTPPVLAVPADMTASATSPAGAGVVFSATAVDIVDGTFEAACAPLPGGTFPIGTTTVACTATDTHGNTGSDSFTVHVKGAAEQLADLAVAVQGVGPRRVAAKVADAQTLLARGKIHMTCRTLTRFTVEVRASSGTIPPDQAAALLASAEQIRAVLRC